MVTSLTPYSPMIFKLSWPLKPRKIDVQLHEPIKMLSSSLSNHSESCTLVNLTKPYLTQLLLFLGAIKTSFFFSILQRFSIYSVVTTKNIGFYDTLTTSVLLNWCGIISSDNLVIIKLANKDSGLDICLWILETLLRWRWFGEHRCRWYNIIVTCLEQHSHNLWRLSCVCIVSASVSHLLKLMLWNRYSNIGEGFRRGVFEWNCGG